MPLNLYHTGQTRTYMYQDFNDVGWSQYHSSIPSYHTATNVPQSASFIPQLRDCFGAQHHFRSLLVGRVGNAIDTLDFCYTPFLPQHTCRAKVITLPFNYDILQMKFGNKIVCGIWLNIIFVVARGLLFSRDLTPSCIYVLCNMI